LGSVYAVSHLKTDTAGSAALPSPPSGAIAQLPADTAPSTEAESVSMPPEEEDKLFKLGETQRLGDLYVDEINWLESQNSSLEAEIEVLYAESAEINRELLDLELTVIANLHKPSVCGGWSCLWQHRQQSREIPTCQCRAITVFRCTRRHKFRLTRSVLDTSGRSSTDCICGDGKL
jgi:hypothetical protein